MEQPQEFAALQKKTEQLIVVTGFGQFFGHEIVNASWESVKLLPDSYVYKNNSYRLEKQMIPVEYEAVDKAVEEIWSRKPSLVIHCGVHGQAKCILLEQLAYNNKFTRNDYAGKCLANGSACLINSDKGDDVIHCRLNVNRIIETISDSCGCVPESMDGAIRNLAKASSDVGNYLCGYIYLKSLDRNPSRTLFVHVPPIDKPFSSQKMSEVIYEIIGECVRQLVEDMKTC